MFNKKLKKEIEELRKENVQLKKEVEDLRRKGEKMIVAIDHYKLNYLDQKTKVISWQSAIQDYIMKNTNNDIKIRNYIFDTVADLAHNRFNYLVEENRKHNFDDGTIKGLYY